MRLLKCNNDGKFSLATDFGDNPQYAILSHTWGAESEEVTFGDLADGTGESKLGYNKIRFCGERAKLDGLQYFWVDTCCIDKSSSAELTEAINSMFRWYQNAAKCYVYLSDVLTDNCNQADSLLQSWQSAFENSRWFSRGWTLQELLAPQSVEFFCANGNRLGDKKSLEKPLHDITRIAVSALQGTPLPQFTIKERMSWAKNRVTKREEDMAYSLLGIFDVYMPLIYGEGTNNALSRLEGELYKRSKKHQLDDISTVTSNSPKRLKNLASVPPSGPSRLDLNFLDPESLPSFESPHSIDAATKKSLVDQLYFTQIDKRLTGLTAAHGKTCRWFLTKSEYISWHDLAQHPDHGGFLWIKGNPGTGKSTLMKLLFEEAKLNSKSNPLQITLSFFFLARGTIEERSTIGLYRSLLHQLFEKAPELKDSLEWMTRDGARGIQQSGWHEEALKQTLAHVIQNLGSRLLTLFVDALDECNQDQAAGMIDFFEGLCNHARESQVQLQICFSSRHYPTIVIQKGLEITLEAEIGHEEDIKQYILSKLKLGKSKSKQAELLRSEILEKSSMIFLWVVLVVEILNSKYSDNSFSAIRERLKEIPPGLAELFEMILERHGENLERLQICLKWILFATHPLTPQELYFAIQLSFNKKCSGYWDQEDLDLDRIKAFVRNSSKGLAEITWNEDSKVQFIHESVREFLLGKYKSQWSGISSNFVGNSHEILRNCCLAQLNAPINQDVDLPNPLPRASRVAQLLVKFPFLEYSVRNVLCHANSAQQNAMEQGDFLADFPLERWIFLNNTLEPFDNRRYTKSASLLYILAEKNLADLIRIHPERESCFDIGNERYGLPMFAALATGSDEAVRTFLEVQVGSQPPSSSLHSLWKQYCHVGHKWVSFGRDFTFAQRRSIDSYLAERGNEVVLAFYLEKGANAYLKDKNGRTPLLWAARSGHEAIVKLLLATKGVDADSKDKYSQTPLSWAARSGHEAIVELLLATEGVDANSKDKYSQTPLLWAARSGHEAIVKLLLATKGVDADSKDKYSQTPLLWVARSGHEAIVKLLLETKRVNADSKDKYGQTPLSWAARSGHEAIVKLLTKGVNADSKDASGRTPLSWATENGHKAIVKLLLATEGVDANSKDASGRTPLWLAASFGHEAIVKLLLAIEGVDIDSKDANS